MEAIKIERIENKCLQNSQGIICQAFYLLNVRRDIHL